jgi:hypothetical protein
VGQQEQEVLVHVLPEQHGALLAPGKGITKRASKQRKVTGNVLKIVNGRSTNERLSAEEAFSDPQQTVEQVFYAERHGSNEELRLVRLAFRQYQGRRFRMK